MAFRQHVGPPRTKAFEERQHVCQTRITAFEECQHSAYLKSDQFFGFAVAIHTSLPVLSVGMHLTDSPLPFCLGTDGQSNWICCYLPQPFHGNDLFDQTGEDTSSLTPAAPRAVTSSRLIIGCSATVEIGHRDLYRTHCWRCRATS